jgi:hypothetical protein
MCRVMIEEQENQNLYGGLGNFINKNLATWWRDIWGWADGMWSDIINDIEWNWRFDLSDDTVKMTWELLRDVAISIVVSAITWWAATWAMVAWLRSFKLGAKVIWIINKIKKIEKVEKVIKNIAEISKCTWEIWRTFVNNNLASILNGTFERNQLNPLDESNLKTYLFTAFSEKIPAFKGNNFATRLKNGIIDFGANIGLNYMIDGDFDINRQEFIAILVAVCAKNHSWESIPTHMSELWSKKTLEFKKFNGKRFVSYWKRVYHIDEKWNLFSRWTKSIDWEWVYSYDAALWLPPLKEISWDEYKAIKAAAEKLWTQKIQESQEIFTPEESSD